MQAHVRRRLIHALGALAVAVSAPFPATAWARQAQAQVTTTVAVGRHKTIRLRNIPADTRLALAVRASSRVRVSLLSAEDAARYPNVAEPVFTAPVENAMSFSVTVPAAGTYYIVFDNTRGDAPSKVRILLRAIHGNDAGSATPPPPPDTPAEDAPSRLRQKPGMHDM